MFVGVALHLPPGTLHRAVVPLPLFGLRAQADPPYHALRHGGAVAAAPGEGEHG